VTQHSFIKLKVQFTVKQTVVRTNGGTRIVAVRIHNLGDPIIKTIVEEFHRMRRIGSDSARPARCVVIVIVFRNLHQAIAIVPVITRYVRIAGRELIVVVNVGEAIFPIPVGVVDVVVSPVGQDAGFAARLFSDPASSQGRLNL